MLQVLYEDNHLLAVNKTAGTLVQGDATGDKPLSEICKEYIKQKYQKPGEVFLGVVHRLDRPVSGVVVFARTSKALERMNELFREKQTKKIYWAFNLPCSYSF
jgi:23S rRNA pseudouridine1911/1915/1917 synthase